MEAQGFDYQSAAGYTIRRFGGKEEIIRRLIESEERFRTEVLPECSARWWKETSEPVDTELLFQAIVKALKSDLPDVVKELKELQEMNDDLLQCSRQMDTKISRLIVYLN
jgi:hypothetical protein